MFRLSNDEWFRRSLFTGSIAAHDKEGGLLVPATLPFWLKPTSTLGLFSVMMFIESLHLFAMPSILGPHRRSANR